jgi:hypothetical protein
MSLVAGALSSVVATLIGPAVPLAPVAAAPLVAATIAATPAHTLTVTGAGVGSYPAFDPGIERYAVTTSDATGGTLTVHATTTDPGGVVRVDGRVAAGGTATVTGLADGDEVSVFIEDSAGVAAHSLVYLPAGFPTLETTATSTQVAPGLIGLTLFNFPADGPRFMTAVDRNGVPAHVEVGETLDLEMQPSGDMTVFRPSATLPNSSALVVLDDRWHEVARYETVGLQNTDNHAAIVLADRTRFLMAYEPNAATGMTDSVIQEIDADGDVVWDWSTEGLEDESVRPSSDRDYAHMNSMVLATDGTRDIVASFRHFSSVFRIATRDHGAYEAGDIVWKLGGRDSSFDFPDDPLGGPCAQHAASILANGNILVYDNGSGGLADHLCVDPADPQGATRDRDPWQSRAVEYSLDTVNHHAHVEWSYAPPGRYSWFMGWTERVAGGHTLVGWSSAAPAIASEVTQDGTLLWELQLAPSNPAPPYISYRATLLDVSDHEAPELDVPALPSGGAYAVGQQVPLDFSCTDRGGSSLRSCGGDLRPGDRVDTSTPGPHTLRLTATDGAGNMTTVARSYTVTAAYQPAWTAQRVRAVLHGKRVNSLLTLLNGGTYADSFVLTGSRGNKALAVRYKLGRRDVTRQLLRGTLRTDLLQPGQRLVLRVVVARTDRTRAGDRRTFTVGARSVADSSRQARTGVVARAG